MTTVSEQEKAYNIERELAEADKRNQNKSVRQHFNNIKEIKVVGTFIMISVYKNKHDDTDAKHSEWQDVLMTPKDAAGRALMINQMVASGKLPKKDMAIALDIVGELLSKCQEAMKNGYSHNVPVMASAEDYDMKDGVLIPKNKAASVALATP